MPGVVVDGMDVLAVRQAAEKAVRCRAGKGPTLMECKTYRYTGHSRGDPCGYRSKEEVASWKARDPIPRCHKVLVEQFAKSDAELNKIQRQCQATVEEAVSMPKKVRPVAAVRVRACVCRGGGVRISAKSCRW